MVLHISEAATRTFFLVTISFFRSKLGCSIHMRQHIIYVHMPSPLASAA
jgi:hypothetical protein